MIPECAYKSAGIVNIYGHNILIVPMMVGEDSLQEGNK